MKQERSLIMQNAKDLLNKGLILDNAKAYLTDPNMLNAAVHNSLKDSFGSYVCPDCGIEIKNKKWAMLHKKYHDAKREFKENEAKITKLRPYVE